MSKVIGNGLIGRAFLNKTLPGVVYFCSGVSNSKEKSVAAFERERRLLLDSYKANDLPSAFVYFSSVMAPGKGNEYFEHKCRMEETVKSLYPQNYLVVRLPQVVGLVNNSTLFSEIVRRIRYGLPVAIERRATRSLLDVDDVVRITNFLLEQRASGLCLNCMSAEAISVSELVDLIGEELGLTVDKYFKDKGNEQPVDCKTLCEYLPSSDPLITPGYTRNVVAKYAEILSRVV